MCRGSEGKYRAFAIRFAQGADGGLCERVPLLEQKPNFRDVPGTVRGGFFFRKKPFDGSGSPNTHSALEHFPEWSGAVHFDCHSERSEESAVGGAR